MTKTEQLLANGTVYQDPDDDKRVVLDIPVFMTKEIVDLGGFEMFAAVGGWTPDSKLDPVQFATSMVWDMIRGIIHKALSDQIDARANEEKRELFTNLVPLPTQYPSDFLPADGAAATKDKPADE